MPKKTCKYCGIVPMNHVCPHITKERNKYRNSRDDAKIYADDRWDKIRADIIDECNSICLWSFYVDGEIRSVDCVHHICTVIEDKGQAYNKDNLIALDSEAHKDIHKLYKTQCKDYVIKLLRQLKEYNNLYGYKMEDLGRYKYIVESWIE